MIRPINIPIFRQCRIDIVSK